MSNNHYEPELKQQVLPLYLEEGRTKKSLTEEYYLNKRHIDILASAIPQKMAEESPKQEETDAYAEAKRLRKEIKKLQKENDFLKKRQHSLQRKARTIPVYPETSTII